MITDHAQSPSPTRTLEVSAFRFSDDPRAMGDFLQLIGLSPRVANDAGTWLELQAGSGSVSVHATGAAGSTNAESGRTDLVLVADDVTAFAAGLTERDGLQVDVWDEAFGRQASVGLGDRMIIINEIQPDPYGYRVTEPTPGPVTVVCHCYIADFDNVRELLIRLGFRHPLRDATDDTFRLESAAAGAVVLHRAAEGGDRYEIGLETGDDLEQLAVRLRSAGRQPRPAANGRRIDVVDPDGQPAMITTG